MAIQEEVNALRALGYTGSVNDMEKLYWVSASTGGKSTASLTGNYVVGQTITASLPTGVKGTLQFTRDKLPISGAVANAVNSLNYIIQQVDTGFTIGVDASNQVVSTSGGLIPTGPVPVSLLQVASGTFVSNSVGGQGYGMKSIHTASEALSSIKVVHANWRVNVGTGEVGMGSSASIKCTIEYPIGGTKTQFLYNGVVTGNIPDLTELESDYLSVNIPAGSEFAIYSIWNTTSNVPYFNYYAGDGRSQGMSNPSLDLTVPGSTGNWTTTASIGGVYAGPVAIVASSSNKAVLVAGDSISVGRGDSNYKFQGFISRAFAPVVATGHNGASGDTISNFVVSHNRRVSLSRYYTHVAINMGINDVTSGITAATIQTNTNTMVKYYTDLGKKVAVCTLGPVSTDTASNWASTATQTTHANNAVRISVNNQRLLGVVGASVIYDLNPAIENTLSPEDGLWKSSGGAGQTADGTHENALGYTNASNLINTSLLLNAS